MRDYPACFPEFKALLTKVKHSLMGLKCFQSLILVTIRYFIAYTHSMDNLLTYLCSEINGQYWWNKLFPVYMI